MITYLLLLPILTAFSCCKEGPNPLPPGPKKLEVVWRTPIVPDPNLDYTIVMNPVLYDGVVLFNTEFTLNGYTAPVMFLDTADGTVLDYWSDYSDGPFAYNRERQQYYGNYLFLGGQRSVDCIDMNTRQTQWHGAVAPNTPNLYVSNGYLYRGIMYNGIDPNNSAAIMRTPVNQMSWDTVYAFDKTDNRVPGFDSMGFGTLTSGDEVVVWKNRSYVDGNGTLNRTDIFAYNLTADTLLWRNMDFNEGSGITPLKVENGVVYGLLRHNAVAIDLRDGTTLWIQNFNSISPTLPMEFFEGDLHIEGDRIIVMGPSDELVGLKKSNGHIVLVVQDLPYGIDDRFTYFEGKLFFTGGLQLVIVDVTTGELLVSKRQVEHLGDVRGRVVIDQIRRAMYMHNGKEALCVKISPDL